MPGWKPRNMVALPTKKLEAWRYTDLAPLSALSFAEAPRATAPALPALDVPRLVFVNGVFAGGLSSSLDFAAPFTAGAEDSALPLALLNAEQAHEGVTLNVPDGVDAGTILLFAHA